MRRIFLISSRGSIAGSTRRALEALLDPVEDAARRRAELPPHQRAEEPPRAHGQRVGLREPGAPRDALVLPRAAAAADPARRDLVHGQAGPARALLQLV